VRLDDKPESPKLFACEDVKVIKSGKNANNSQNDENLEEFTEEN
jgi:hypothetical protein